jgi:rfaE bifunctional protein nucleotidyltransferase chain/domain
MNQIIEINQLEKIKDVKEMVLIGGCFDVLHLGHTTFLEKAKKQGKTLVIMLEADETIKRLKGENRPINNQQNRAEMLTKLKMVDWVIKMPEMKTNTDYENLVKKIKPAVIAIAKNDERIVQKTKIAKMVKAKLVEIMEVIPSYSSSRIIEIMNKI